jgi:hypothetical protein
MTTGTSHPGGYNYYIGITNQVTSASLWIYNPYYAPVDPGTSQPLDHFLDDAKAAGGLNNNYPYYYQGPNEEGLTSTAPFDGIHHDAPLFFFRTTFSLYQINSVYNPGDVNSLVAEESFKPFDATSADLNTHSCASGQLYDPNWSNGTGNGNTDNTYYHPNGMVAGAGCVSQPLNSTTAPNSYNCTWVMQWCQLYNFSTTAANNSGGTPVGTAVALQPPGGSYTGQYRLSVEVTGLVAKNNVYNSTLTDGWGQHGYSLKLCAGSPSTPVNCNDGTGSNGASNYNNPAMYLYGLNNMDVTFQTALTNTPANPNYPQTSCVTSNAYNYACMDLGCIPTLYAGRTMTLSIFDPGDGAGNLFLGVSPPQGAGTGTSVAYSYSGGGAIPTVAYDGRNVFQVHTAGASPPYNGLWVDVTLTLSSNYIGDCATTSGKTGYSGWWQLVYLTTDTSSASQPDDQIGVKFTLVGSPVHLTTIG